MNHPSLVRRLIAKDLMLQRWPLTLYFVVGLVSLYLLSINASAPFNTGAVLLMSMVIITGAHLVFSTLVNERSEQTLVFVLSLPVTFRQYSHAKVCANLIGYLAVWLPLVGGMVLVIHSQAQIPNGLTVYAVILMLELLAAFVLVLSAALVTESLVWVIVLITTTNIGVSIFMHWLSSVPGINAHMNAPQAIWNQTALVIIGAELLIVLACLAATYVVQARKRDFL